MLKTHTTLRNEVRAKKLIDNNKNQSLIVKQGQLYCQCCETYLKFDNVAKHIVKFRTSMGKRSRNELPKMIETKHSKQLSIWNDKKDDKIQPEIFEFIKKGVTKLEIKLYSVSVSFPIDKYD